MTDLFSLYLRDDGGSVSGPRLRMYPAFVGSGYRSCRL